MDLNNLVESGNAVIAVLTTMGATTIISIFTFFKANVSGKKFNKVSDFAVVADQSIKFAKAEIQELKKEIVDEVMNKVVEPMKLQVKQLSSDNSQLASVAVSLLSLIPMPLDVRKDAVKVIGTLGNVSAEAKVLLDTSIANQEAQTVLENKENSNLSDNINEI